MDNLIRYAWQQTVLDAFLSPPADVAAKVKIAEQGIRARLRDALPVDASERMALEDGLRALNVLVSEAKAEAAEHSWPEENKYRTPAF
jgi:hypothetical protein